MPISLIGSATGINSATIPAHNTGDLLIIAAFRDGSSTPPTFVAGWSNILTQGANICSMALRYKVATSSSEVTGTWTNATGLICLVYRSTTGSISIGTAVGDGASSTSIDWPAKSSALVADKLYLGFVGHRQIDTGIETAPSGMTNITSYLDGVSEVAAHTTSPTSGNWAAQSQSVGGTSSGWRCIVLDLSDGTSIAVGSSSGTSTADGVYEANSGTASSTGAASASAEGSSIFSSVAQSVSTTTNVFNSESLFSAAFVSYPSSSAEAVGATYKETSFLSTSVSTSLGAGSQIVQSEFSAAGQTFVMGLSIDGWVGNSESNTTVVAAGAIMIDGVPHIPLNGAGWISPASGTIDTVLELQENYSYSSFSAEIDNDPNGVIFAHVAGVLPDNINIVNPGNGTATLEADRIEELDTYISGWTVPPGFTYDSLDTAGGNYASYGSGLYGGKLCSFVIRAYREGDLDSNGGQVGSDRFFSIMVENNYSSDAARFITEYYANERLTYVTTSGVKHENLTPEEYIIKLQEDGYLPV